MANNLDELCSSVLWEAKIGSDDIGYLAEKISKQKVEGTTWFLLTCSSEIEREERQIGVDILSHTGLQHSVL